MARAAVWSALEILRGWYPMGGRRMPVGKFGENNQMEPDIRVRNDPDIMTGGRGRQLEAAVNELLAHK